MSTATSAPPTAPAPEAKARLASRAPAWARDAWVDVWPVFWRSRLFILVVAAFATSLFALAPDVMRERSVPWIHPFDGWPLGAFVDFWLTPLARWDAIWYLSIALDGYQPETIAGNPGDKHAFFPLYPIVVRALSVNGSDATVLIASQVVSLAALLVGLLCVHRLTVIELGQRFARPAVALLAFSPVAFFLSAPYTESLFLALTAGAFLAARTGRWWLAGLLGLLAGATRNTGFLLLIPLLLLYAQRPGAEPPWSGLRRPRFDVLWLVLVPVGLIAHAFYLERSTGDAVAFSSAQDPFGRLETVTPFEGAWRGLEAFFADGIADLAGGTDLAAQNVFNFVVFAVAVAAIVVCLRRRLLPLAYPAWAAIGIGVPLFAPAYGEPLRTMPRFVLVLFPVWMILAWVFEQRGWTQKALVVFTVLLGIITAGFATWVSWN